MKRLIHKLFCLLTLICMLMIAVNLIETQHNLQEMKDELLIIDEKLESEVALLEESYIGENNKSTYPKLYTNEDVIVLTKMLWGEARGVPDLNIDGKCVSSKCQQAAVIWTVLNRYDLGYADTISDVTKAKGQFVGYRKSNPIDEELMDLVEDVLERWNDEKHGETDVGRVLPSDYLWFRGNGTYNVFRNEYNSNSSWTWELADPYI